MGLCLRFLDTVALWIWPFILLLPFLSLGMYLVLTACDRVVWLIRFMVNVVKMAACAHFCPFICTLNLQYRRVAPMSCSPVKQL